MSFSVRRDQEVGSSIFRQKKAWQDVCKELQQYNKMMQEWPKEAVRAEVWSKDIGLVELQHSGQSDS